MSFFNTVLSTLTTGLSSLYHFTSSVMYTWLPNPVYRAARINDISSLSWYVKKGYNVNKVHSWTGGILTQDTPLHIAAEKGRYSAVKLLLEHGADVNQKSRNFMSSHTPLAEVMHDIIKHTGSQTMTDVTIFPSFRPGDMGSFIISHRPVDYAHDILPKYEIAKLLVQHGADIQTLPQEYWNIKNHFYRFLEVAIKENDVQTLSKVLDAFDDKESASHASEVKLGLEADSKSLLLSAIWLDAQPEIVQMLLDKGAQVNAAIVSEALKHEAFTHAHLMLEHVKNHTPLSECSESALFTSKLLEDSIEQSARKLQAKHDELLEEQEYLNERLAHERSQGKEPSALLSNKALKVETALVNNEKMELAPVNKMKILFEQCDEQAQHKTPINVSDVLDLSPTFGPEQVQQELISVHDVLHSSPTSANASLLLAPIHCPHVQELAPMDQTCSI